MTDSTPESTEPLAEPVDFYAAGERLRGEEWAQNLPIVKQQSAPTGRLEKILDDAGKSGIFPQMRVRPPRARKED